MSITIQNLSLNGNLSLAGETAKKDETQQTLDEINKGTSPLTGTIHMQGHAMLGL